MIEYKILAGRSDQSIGDFERAVQAHINNGWALAPTPAISVKITRIIIAQALTRVKVAK